MRVKKLIKESKGFTLIEVLIYSAIVAVFLTSSIVFVYNLVNSSERATANNELAVNKDSIEKRLSLLIGQANKVVEPAKNESGEVLALENSEVDYYPVTFGLSNKRIFLSLSGKNTYPITNNRIVVGDFNVEHIETDQTSSTLKIDFLLESGGFRGLKTTSTLFYVISK